MTNLSTKTITSLGKVEELPGIERTGEWKDRVYINLEFVDRRFAGDRNLRIWVRDDRLCIEGRKGSTSATFDTSLQSFLAGLRKIATKISGGSDTIEGFYAIS
jgi:hypothetical protein